MPYYNREPKGDHNFDNHPNGHLIADASTRLLKPGRVGSLPVGIAGVLHGLGPRVPFDLW